MALQPRIDGQIQLRHGHGHTPLAGFFTSPVFKGSAAQMRFILAGEHLLGKLANLFGLLIILRINHTGLHAAKVGQPKMVECSLAPPQYNISKNANMLGAAKKVIRYLGAGNGKGIRLKRLPKIIGIFTPDDIAIQKYILSKEHIVVDIVLKAYNRCSFGIYYLYYIENLAQSVLIKYLFMFFRADKCYRPALIVPA